MCTPISVLFVGTRQREEWLKGNTKMWDVFPDDMGLDNGVELAMSSFMLGIIYVSGCLRVVPTSLDFIWRK
jgi:hypothetical protein